MVFLQEKSTSLTQYLDLLKPLLSESLIDAEHWANIEAIAHWLPGSITNFFGFEFPLGDPIPQADFLLHIGSEEIGQQILAGQTSRYLLHPGIFTKPIWQQIQKFTQSWLDESSLLCKHINNIWLEFDVDGTLQNFPIPSCFFGSNTIRFQSGVAKNTCAWVTQIAITQLQGHSINSDIEEQLFHCIDVLPQEAYIFQVGLMLARHSEQVRICIRNISTLQIVQYLEKLNWSGSITKLESILSTYGELVDRIDIDLDIGASGLGSKLGLECYLRAQPRHNPRWETFLNTLSEVRLCLPQKRDALLAYPSFIREKNHRHQWPSHLLKLSQFLGTPYEGVFFQGLHHIKLVYKANQITEAKAYGWVSQQILGKTANP